MKSLINENRLNRVITETINEYIDNIESVQDLQTASKGMEFVYCLGWYLFSSFST